jgi:hypothetical protein
MLLNVADREGVWFHRNKSFKYFLTGGVSREFQLPMQNQNGDAYKFYSVACELIGLKFQRTKASIKKRLMKL